MAKMGRPKLDDPIAKVVTIKIKSSQYERMLAYCQKYNLTISKMIRQGIEMQLDSQNE